MKAISATPGVARSNLFEQLRRPIRIHEGSVIVAASNQRWASDGLEIPCWNGEVVRIAFAIDTYDREIITWVATQGGGISGGMIRDMMLDCVERRFNALRAPFPVQWLADNDSAYTVAETTDFAVTQRATAFARPSSKTCNATMPA